jgi:hypothetical protein
MKAPRAGEVLAFMGSVAIAISLGLRWYETPSGSLSVWDTFGVAVVLLLLAALGGLVLMIATLSERSTALPVAAGVWTTLLGLLGTIAAVVRALERPHGATALCAGAWLGLAGALLVLIGAWLSMRDERPDRYRPAEPPPRQPPPREPPFR